MSFSPLQSSFNYITTKYLTVQIYNLIDLFRNPLMAYLCPLPPNPWNLVLGAFFAQAGAIAAGTEVANIGILAICVESRLDVGEQRLSW